MRRAALEFVVIGAFMAVLFGWAVVGEAALG
jgi:hypothetical protein